MRTVILITALFTTAFSAAAPADPDLVRVNSRYFDEAAVGATAEAGRATRFHIADLDFQGIRIDQPDTNLGRDEWTLTEADKAGLNAIYVKAMEKRFSKSGYQVVSAPGEGIVEGMLPSRRIRQAERRGRLTDLEHETLREAKARGIIRPGRPGMDRIDAGRIR